MENHFESLETGNSEPGHGRWTVNNHVIKVLKIDVKDKHRKRSSDQAVFPYLEGTSSTAQASQGASECLCRILELRVNRQHQC
jgi:hypothetical protein